MIESDDEYERRFAALPNGVQDAIDAIMLLFETMQKHQETITIGALAEGIELVMTDGYDMAEIYLAMVSFASRRAKEGRRLSRND